MWGFAEYLHECSTRYTDPTMRLCAFWLGLFQAYCQEHHVFHPHQLEAQHVTDFQTALRWQPNRAGRLYSAHSVDQAMRFVRAWCRWANRGARLEHNPAAQLVLPHRAPAAPVILSAPELQAVLDQPDRITPRGLRNRCLLAVLASTELGLGDVVSLNREDPLELEGAQADELAAYRRHGRPRLLREVAEPALFLASAGQRITLMRVRQIMVAAGVEAGLNLRLGARILRRSYQAHRERFRARHSL